MSNEKKSEYIKLISKRLKKKTAGLYREMEKFLKDVYKEEGLTDDEKKDIAARVIVSPFVTISRSLSPEFSDRVGIYRMIQETDFKIEFPEPEVGG